MFFPRCACAVLLAVGLAGCGSSSVKIHVSGTVTLNDKPLPHALVSFYPEGGTGGLGGSGRTDADGKYTLTPARGSGGLEPGTYLVVISRPLRPDGSAPPPEVPPIEADARETLPPTYSSREQSRLKATVETKTTAYDFKLRTPGK